MHGKMHVKQKINEKERVIWTYRLRERDSLQEKWRKTTKNLSGALPSWRERGYHNFLGPIVIIYRFMYLVVQDGKSTECKSKRQSILIYVGNSR